MRPNRQFASMVIAALLTFVLQDSAWAQCTLPFTLSNGQPPDATKVMANFNALAACLNPGGSANSIQYNSGSGTLAGIGPLTNGQLLIGSSGNAPQAQTLTAGSGIAVTNGAGSVAIAATGGAASTGLYRQVMSSTPTVATTGLSNWVNQGTTIFSEGLAGLSLNAPGIGSNFNLVGRYRPVPATPYTIRALVSNTRNSANGSRVGIGWYDGFGKFHAISYVTPVVVVEKYSAVGAIPAADVTSASNGYSQPIWLQLKDDGTNVSFAFSQDGANFLTLFSVAKSSGFLGASGYNQVIFFVNPSGASNTIGTLMSWTQT